jgi:ABC-type Fe3+/spermidine/putrescine transport system ATPase subunit
MAPPQEVYGKPADRFVAQFVGEMNFIQGEVAGSGEIDRPWEDSSARSERSERRHFGNAGGPPGACPSFRRSGPAGDFHRGKITSKNYLGDCALLEVEVKGISLIAKLAGDSELAIGSAQWWRFRPIDGTCFLERLSVAQRSDCQNDCSRSFLTGGLTSGNCRSNLQSQFLCDIGKPFSGSKEFYDYIHG